MKIKFAKIKNEKFNMDYDWMILLDSQEALDWYLETWLKSEASKCTENVKDYMDMKAHVEHPFFVSMYHSQKTDTNYFVALAKMVNMVETSIRDTFKIYGSIVVNKLGGCLPMTEDFKVMRAVEKEISDIIFPSYTKEDIRVKQWQDGTHWYAYVGNYSVIYNKKRKWDTKKEAEEKAKHFLYKLNRQGFEIKGNEVEY